MNPAAETILKQLKAVHQPAAINWWPLAPGWYGLVVLLLLSVVVFFIVKRHRSRLLRKALQQVAALRLRFQQYTDKQQVTSQLVVLLKQALFVRHSRLQVSGLVGEEWLLFLDEVVGSKEYSQGPGRLLLTAPYAAQTQANLDELFLLVEKTLRRCL